jgi:hypothetical protein
MELSSFRRPTNHYDKRYNRIFSVISIRQYSNSSVISFNIDWDNTMDYSSSHTNFEMLIAEPYDCRMLDGAGGSGHNHYNFVIWPPLPANPSGIQLIFKEYKIPLRDEQIGDDIIFTL